MARPIKHGSTDQSVVIRIVDSTDGTPETGVTAATSGLALEYRREGATSTAITESDLTNLNDAHADGGMKHIGNGYYRVDVPDAAFAAGADGVLIHGTVTGMVVLGVYVPLVANLEADTYARLGAPAGASIAADVAGVQSDTNDIQTRLPAALVSGRIDASVGAMASGVVTATAVATGAIDADALATDAVAEIADGVWDEARSGHTTDGTFGQAFQVVDSGTAQGGGSNTITLRSGYSSGDDRVNGALVFIVSGTGAGQGNVISDYNNSTKVATVQNTWATNPDNTSVYVLYPGASGVTTAQIASAIWDAATSSHTTAGTLGKAVADVLDDTGTSGVVLAADSVTSTALATSAVTEIQSGLATSSALSTLQTDVTTVLARLGAFAGSGLNTVLGFFRALMRKDAALTPSDVGGTYDNTTDSNEAVKDNQLDAAVSSRATPAQVNAEVLDVLGTDTWAELSALPGEDLTTLRHMIQFLYQRERLKRTATASAEVMYKKDGATALGTAALADDGTTFSKGSAA